MPLPTSRRTTRLLSLVRLRLCQLEVNRQYKIGNHWPESLADIDVCVVCGAGTAWTAWPRSGSLNSKSYSDIMMEHANAMRQEQRRIFGSSWRCCQDITAVEPPQNWGLRGEDVSASQVCPMHHAGAKAVQHAGLHVRWRLALISS